MPASISSTFRRAGAPTNTASWMSRDEYFDARRTMTSSPRSHHSTFEPGVSPSLRRIRAGIDTCPWEVTFDSIESMCLISLRDARSLHSLPR